MGNWHQQPNWLRKNELQEIEAEEYRLCVECYKRFSAYKVVLLCFIEEKWTAYVIEKHMRISTEKFCVNTWMKTKVIKHLEAFTEKEIPKQIWLDGLLVNEQYSHFTTLEQHLQ